MKTVKEILDAEMWCVLGPQTIDRIKRELADIEHKADQYDSIVSAIKPADGGQYRADTIESILHMVNENKRLAEKLQEYRDDYKNIMAESCDGSDDRKHCTCVPPLKLRVRELEARIAELEKPPQGGEFERVVKYCAYETGLYWHRPMTSKQAARYLGTNHFVPVEWLRCRISELAKAHATDLRAAEARHREEVKELVEWIADVIPAAEQNCYVSPEDIADGKALIAKHNGGEA